MSFTVDEVVKLDRWSKEMLTPLCVIAGCTMPATWIHGIGSEYRCGTDRTVAVCRSHHKLIVEGKP